MSQYVIQDTTLTGIANAIRAKTGDNNSILVSNLASAITNLPSGGGSVDSEYITNFSSKALTTATDFLNDTDLSKIIAFIWIRGDNSNGNISVPSAIRVYLKGLNYIYTNVNVTNGPSNATILVYDDIVSSNGAYNYSTYRYQGTAPSTPTNNTNGIIYNSSTNKLQKVYYSNNRWVIDSWDDSGIIYLVQEA